MVLLTIGCCFVLVNIYEKSFHKDLSDRTKEQIASLLYSQLKNITVNICSVQKQSGADKRFALAFATSLWQWNMSNNNDL